MTGKPLDRRVRKTRDAIGNALLGLLHEKGYDAVTVADIIERADIGRSTFYNHFTDKQHVLYASLDELAEFLRAQRAARPGHLFGFSLAMFEHVQEQRLLLRAMLGRRGGTVVQQRIQHILAELVREELTANGRTIVGVPVDVVVDVVVGAYLALLARWADDVAPGTPGTPTEMDAAFRTLIIPGITAVIRPS